MPRSKRAKLFMAFDALSGYSEALAEKEVVYERRRALDEEARRELDEKLCRLWEDYRQRQSGTKYRGGGDIPRLYESHTITVEYFKETPGKEGAGQYLTITGKLKKMDLRQRYLLLESACASEDKQCQTHISLSDISRFSGEVFELPEI